MLSEIGLDKIRQTDHPITWENAKKRSQHIVTLDEPAIEMDLIAEYATFKIEKQYRGFCRKIKTRLNQLCDRCIFIMRLIWLEVIPKHVCGVSKKADHHQKGNEKRIFDQFRKKKTRFFLIVLGADCGEQQIQQAYQNASCITAEGLSLSLSELRNRTNCIQWSLPSLASCKKYFIIFMKFDCFDHLLHFGQLSQQYIVSMGSRQNEMEAYKRQLQECFRTYEQIERGFIGSYVQKQDKLLFE